MRHDVHMGHIEEAAVRGARSALEHHYTDGTKRVVAEPSDHTYHYSSFFSTDLAMVAGITTPRALKNLRRLSAYGHLVEVPRTRLTAGCRFRLPRAQYDDLARKLIAQRIAEGWPVKGAAIAAEQGDDNGRR